MFSSLLNSIAVRIHRTSSRAASVRSRPSRRMGFQTGIEGLEGRAIPSALMLQAPEPTVQGGALTITPPGSWDSTPLPKPPATLKESPALRR